MRQIEMSELPLHILYLDEYHAGDRLLIDRLGRGLGGAQRLRLLIVHDPAEAVSAVTGEAGGTADDAAGGARIERAVRTSNKQIVALLTEAGTPAIGVLGSDRGLMEGDSVTEKGAHWLFGQCGLGTVPVVSPLSSDPVRPGRCRLVDGRQLLLGLLTWAPPESIVIAEEP